MKIYSQILSEEILLKKVNGKFFIPVIFQTKTTHTTLICCALTPFNCFLLHLLATITTILLFPNSEYLIT